MPYPQVAGSPSRRTKNNTPLVERAKVWRGCRIAVVGVGASLRRLCAPPSCILARRACSFGFASLRNFGQALSRILAFAVVVVAASVHRQPFVPLHLCNDSHLCRCIVQRLYVVAFMHPCITTLCDRYRASFARRACSVGFASCLVSRLGCRIVWQLSAADFKHPCLKLWAFIL